MAFDWPNGLYEIEVERGMLPYLLLGLWADGRGIDSGWRILDGWAASAIFRHLHNVLRILYKLGDVVEIFMHCSDLAAQMVHYKVYCKRTVLETAEDGRVLRDEALQHVPLLLDALESHGVLVMHLRDRGVDDGSEFIRWGYAGQNCRGSVCYRTSCKV